MALPKWFDYELYMKNKLAWMQKSDSSYTMDDLVAAFNEHGFSEAEGAYKHFQQYGHKEDVSPNALFDADYYYQSKALQYYQLEENGGMTADQIKANMDLYAANMKQAIAKAGMDAWTHYTKYGTAEGVNPSAGFDTEAYMEAKYEAWSATEAGSGKTLDEMKAIFKSANINALAHAIQYGTDPETATEGEAQCWTDASHETLTEDIASNDDGIDGGESSEGQTFTLTTGIDTITGTSGDDTVNGLSAAAPDGTYTAGDAIDTGDGTDTMNLTLNGQALDASVTVDNLEILNLRELGAAGADLAGFTGLEEVWSAKSTGALAVTGIQNAVKLGLKDTSVDLTATFVDGTYAKAATIDIETSGKVGVAATPVAVTLGHATAANANTDTILNVTAKDGEAFLTYTDGAQAIGVLQTVQVGEGSGNLTLTAAGTEFDGVKTYDASAATGNITLTAGAFDATADDVKVTGGSGDDTFDLSGATLGAKLTVDGGDGEDSVAIATDNTAGAVALDGTFKNIEKIALSVTGTIAAGDVKTLDATSISGVDSIALGAITGTDATSVFQVNNLANGSTIEISGAHATVTTELNIAANAKTASNLSLNVTLADAADVAALAIDDAVKTLNITAEGTSTVTALTGTGLTTIDMTGGAEGSDLTLSAVPAGSISFKMGVGVEQITVQAGDKASFVYTDAAQSASDALDIITGFDVANATIDLSALSKGTFKFVGEATEFSKDAGNTQVRCEDDTTNTTVFVDLDGDATADMEIQLAGIADAANVTAANFLPAA